MNAILVPSSRRRFNWRRVLIALFGVPALLVGLLAMHFLASDISSPEVHSMGAPVSDSPQLVVAHDEAPALTSCGEMCGPTHDMLGMACVLALLVSAILLTLTILALQFPTLRDATRVIVAHLSALAPPPSPSLHVLSISRT